MLPTCNRGRIIGYFSLISTGWLLFLSKQHRHQITHPSCRKIGFESQHITTELESSTGAIKQKSTRNLKLTKKSRAEGLSLNTAPGPRSRGWGVGGTGEAVQGSRALLVHSGSGNFYLIAAKGRHLGMSRELLPREMSRFL